MQPACRPDHVKCLRCWVPGTSGAARGRLKLPYDVLSSSASSKGGLRSWSSLWHWVAHLSSYQLLAERHMLPNSAHGVAKNFLFTSAAAQPRAACRPRLLATRTHHSLSKSLIFFDLRCPTVAFSISGAARICSFMRFQCLATCHISGAARCLSSLPKTTHACTSI